MDNSFVIIGGDDRQKYLYEEMKRKNYPVNMVFNSYETEPQKAFDIIMNAGVVILPIPTTKDAINLFTKIPEQIVPLSQIKSKINSEAVVFYGGNSGEYLCKKAINLLEYEPYVLYNAMATAEAAVSLIIDKTELTIFDSQIIILGYGRIAKILAAYLKALNANVTVCARRESARYEAEVNGFNSISFEGLSQQMQLADVVVNTVPKMVIGKRELLSAGEDILILDLASAEGGVDYKAAKTFGVKAIHALSLPGKMSPKSAGMYIEKSVSMIISTIY